MINPVFQPQVLTLSELIQTGEFLAKNQQRDGMIPWYPGGHADPWNHTEAVIALFLCGRIREATAGLRWLSSRQNRDGSFCHYYQKNGVKEPRRDLNCCIYPAVGLYLGYQLTRSTQMLEEFRPMISAALNYVASHQHSDGSFPWAVDPDGRPHVGRLLAGSSSMVISLSACEALFRDAPQEALVANLVRQRLADAMTSHRLRFDDKSDWAMDWYYPLLAGLGDREVHAFRTGHLLSRHLDKGGGIRCVASSPWVTAAETAEFAAALSLTGRGKLAQRVASGLTRFRTEEGGYYTGISLTNGKTFPGEESSTYSAAAVVLADFVLQSEVQGTLLNALEEVMVPPMASVSGL